MATRYFENLPYVYHSNTLVRDISRRVVINGLGRRSPYNFYPYDIKNNLRSDQVSERYYDDSRLDWLIYHINGVIDPYYGWYLDQYQFEAHINKTYGSYEKAVERIYFYRVNWSDDMSEIPASFYNNTLAQSLKKYFSPVFGKKNEIISYRRKEQDTNTNTNRILQYTISANNGSTGFTETEIVDLRDTPTNQIGTGECVFSNSTTITIKNVSGNTIANSTVTPYIIGETSGANVTVNGVTTLVENISEVDEVYWSAVTYYDYEVECNEKNKLIYLNDPDVTQNIVNEFEDELQIDTDPITNVREND